MDKNDQNGAASAVRSLDELDGAVKITTPGIWMVLLACFALLAGIFAWGYFGAVSSGVSASGIVKDGDKNRRCCRDRRADLHRRKDSRNTGIKG